MLYPIKATFYAMTSSENDYGEVTKTKAVSFSTGSNPVTLSFKDRIQGQIALDGEKLYLNVRKNPHTSAVKVGDHVTLHGSIKTYNVIGIDQKLTDRSALVMLIDALEAI